MVMTCKSEVLLVSILMRMKWNGACEVKNITGKLGNYKIHIVAEPALEALAMTLLYLKMTT